jgi:hypothetical protein
LPRNILICLLNADASYHELCIKLRDRLQIEQQYSMELIITSSCESLDSLIHFIDRSLLCIFCASTKMKTDNLAHFIHQYISLQSNSMPILTILIENDCELEGNWLESLTIVDIQSIPNEIRRYVNQIEDSEIRVPSRIRNQIEDSDIRVPSRTRNQIEDSDLRLPSRTSDASTISHIRNVTPDELRNHSRNYINYPVPYWSPDDVTEWCEATQGSFETLHPLVMRLNGSALVQLAEILSIEPASMYHSLNDELIQRTGTSVPLTEYVSLQSELQHLLLQNQNQKMIMSPPMTPDNTNKNSYRKKRWRKSRLCTIL